MPPVLYPGTKDYNPTPDIFMASLLSFATVLEIRDRLANIAPPSDGYIVEATRQIRLSAQKVDNALRETWDLEP
jgi:hypothetical protein